MFETNAKAEIGDIRLQGRIQILTFLLSVLSAIVIVPLLVDYFSA